MATVAGDLRRGMGARLRGRPARRLAHGARGAAADRRAPRPARRHLLRLRLRQRHAQQPLRGRQGRGRVAGPRAAGRADAARARAPASPTSAGSTPSWSRTPSPRRTPTGCSENTARLPAASGSRPTRPAPALVRGIEERAPRIFAPKWWRYVSALRGIINPLLDRRIEQRPRTPTAIDSRGRGGSRRAGRGRAISPSAQRSAASARSSRKTKDS